LAPSSAGADADRSRGPATGVVTIAKSPTATSQHASGALPRSSSLLHDAGAVPVRRATWIVARTIPAPNQTAKVGNQLVWTVICSPPRPMAASHVRVTRTLAIVRMFTVRNGRQRRPSARMAITGSRR